MLTVSSGGYFQAVETVILNTGAVIFFLAARAGKKAEIKWVAVALITIGGGKVFLYDLFKIRGVPVVLGVLSFVIAAALGSLVLSRWQHIAGGDGD